MFESKLMRVVCTSALVLGAGYCHVFPPRAQPVATHFGWHTASHDGTECGLANTLAP